MIVLGIFILFPKVHNGMITRKTSNSEPEPLRFHKIIQFQIRLRKTLPVSNAQKPFCYLNCSIGILEVLYIGYVPLF
jgi:hypothetical protein